MASAAQLLSQLFLGLVSPRLDTRVVLKGEKLLATMCPIRPSRSVRIVPHRSRRKPVRVCHGRIGELDGLVVASTLESFFLVKLSWGEKFSLRSDLTARCPIAFPPHHGLLSLRIRVFNIHCLCVLSRSRDDVHCDWQNRPVVAFVPLKRRVLGDFGFLETGNRALHGLLPSLVKLISTYRRLKNRPI